MVCYNAKKILENKIGFVNTNPPETMPPLIEGQTLVALVGNYQWAVATFASDPEGYKKIYDSYAVDGWYRKMYLVTVPTSKLADCRDDGITYPMEELERYMGKLQFGKL